ncbi:MAG: hypothetical protein M9932_01560 [Xanthobacteraceae bacterium]|nr:hypothetical protein [Xanthobacteraceae bacterium]
MVMVGDMVVGANKLAKVIAIDDNVATMVRIVDERIETFTYGVKALTRLRDALQPKSLWLECTQRDAIEVIKEEERAKAEAAEQERRSRKPKRSKKIKRGKNG